MPEYDQLKILRGRLDTADRHITTLNRQNIVLRKQNAAMEKALAVIAEPANAHCGCSHPCRCDDEGLEAIRMGDARSLAIEVLAILKEK